jgi:hypothetical protein
VPVSWGEHDNRVAALVVYGSVAQGRADELSDLDLIVVARAGHRKPCGQSVPQWPNAYWASWQCGSRSPAGNAHTDTRPGARIWPQST